MRRVNRKRIKHKKNKKGKGKLSVRRILAKRRWVSRKKKTLSPYPYLMTFSSYKTHVFFTVADINGKTQALISTGQAGFKDRDRTAYMVIVRVTTMFLKKVRTLKINDLIVIFRNCTQRRVRFGIRSGLRRFRKRYTFRYLATIIQNRIAFNGCRKKKERR